MGFIEFVKELGVYTDVSLYTCMLQLAQPARKKPEALDIRLAQTTSRFVRNSQSDLGFGLHARLDGVISREFDLKLADLN